MCHCIPTYLINYVQRLMLSLSLIRIALEQKHKAENIPAGDRIPVSTVCYCSAKIVYNDNSINS